MQLLTRCSKFQENQCTMQQINKASNQLKQADSNPTQDIFLNSGLPRYYSVYLVSRLVM